METNTLLKMKVAMTAQLTILDVNWTVLVLNQVIYVIQHLAKSLTAPQFVGTEKLYLTKTVTTA